MLDKAFIFSMIALAWLRASCFYSSLSVISFSAEIGLQRNSQVLTEFDLMQTSMHFFWSCSTLGRLLAAVVTVLDISDPITACLCSLLLERPFIAWMIGIAFFRPSNFLSQFLRLSLNSILPNSPLDPEPLPYRLLGSLAWGIL